MFVSLPRVVGYDYFFFFKVEFLAKGGGTFLSEIAMSRSGFLSPW